MFLRGLSLTRNTKMTLERPGWGDPRRGRRKRRAQEGIECGPWDVSAKADFTVTPVCGCSIKFGGVHLKLGGGGQRACPG